MQITTQHKINYLEGLRGIAALVVVIHHFVVAFYPELHYGNGTLNHFEESEAEQLISFSPLSILYSGNFAVCIFFVLSGFVLTKKFFENGSTITIVSMGIKRYPRLIIPIALSSLLTYGFLKWGYIIPWYKNCFTHSSWLCSLWPTDGDWIHFLKTTFIGVPLKGSQDYNTVLWTIKYEFLGSLMLVAFCLLVQWLKNHSWLIYLAALILIFYFCEFYYLGFLAGAGFSHLSTKPRLLLRVKKEINPRKKILVAFVSVFILLLASFPGIDNGDSFSHYSFMWLPVLNAEQMTILYHTLASIGLMWLVLYTAAIQHFLSKPIFLFLGKISFSMYLLHVLLIGLSTHLLAELTMFKENWQYFFSTLLTFAAYLTVLLPLSRLFTRFADQPAVRYSRLIDKVLSDV